MDKNLPKIKQRPSQVTHETSLEVWKISEISIPCQKSSKWYTKLEKTPWQSQGGRIQDYPLPTPFKGVMKSPKKKKKINNERPPAFKQPPRIIMGHIGLPYVTSNYNHRTKSIFTSYSYPKAALNDGSWYLISTTIEGNLPRDAHNFQHK